MKHVACHIENYPRPLFVKKEWACLNGVWKFAFDDGDKGLKEEWFKGLPSSVPITVPFAYQTKASGIEDASVHPVVWYERDIEFPRHNGDERVFLNFEGVDYESDVFVNGRHLAHHRGGYTRFAVDVTDALKNGIGKVVVRAEDRNDAFQPRGKQSWLFKPFGCWYQATTGIWKTVWAEVRPSFRLEKAKTTPIYDKDMVSFDLTFSKPASEDLLEIRISFEGKLMHSLSVKPCKTRIHVAIDTLDLDDAFRCRYWKPESPLLFDIEYVYFHGGKGTERIGSYFGFRSFYRKGNILFLNQNPIYSRMVLKQGYWREGGLTPPDEEALFKDVALIKELGFNGVRMHQKIEDERFYYACDVLGLLVWAEMPSPYEFQDETVVNLSSEWMEAVEQLHNFASIVVWVPINESWGIPRINEDPANQALANALVQLTKALDPSRLVISNDGWEHTESDILTIHDYAASGQELSHFFHDLPDVLNGANRVGYSPTRAIFAGGYVYKGQPVIISEFAGIGYEVGDEGWGYGKKESNQEAFLERLNDLVGAVVKMDGIAGFCLTQYTDVAQEINGLCNFDRHPKAPISAIRQIIEQ